MSESPKYWQMLSPEAYKKLAPTDKIKHKAYVEGFRAAMEIQDEDVSVRGVLELLRLRKEARKRYKTRTKKEK